MKRLLLGFGIGTVGSAVVWIWAMSDNEDEEGWT